jgi:YrbI family 3-deoxy-D-manno-octulosonate 8-phosphate phosphatase
MYKGKRIIAVIPARGGSKSVPRKNLKEIAGKPLIVWTIEQSLKSKYIDATYVSSDDPEIKKIAWPTGAAVINRPKSLASDKASTESALFHASEVLNEDYDLMILLQCTSPLRYPHQLDEAIEQLFAEGSDSLLSGCLNDRFLWRKGVPMNYDYKNRPRRQDKDWEFVENGSFYIFKKEVLLKQKNRLGGKISQYIMPKWMSFEIDEPDDFELLEYLMKKKRFPEEFLKEKAKKIKMILFDVDGVFTDGSVYLNAKGEEELKFSRLDGKGIELLRTEGFQLGVISSEDSQIVRKRMEKLKIKEIHLGVKDKPAVYEALKKTYKLKDEEICFCGDDVQDLEVLKRVGLSCCPLNAQSQVKRICDYVSGKKGGEGFVRDVCNLTLN